MPDFKIEGLGPEPLVAVSQGGTDAGVGRLIKQTARGSVLKTNATVAGSTNAIARIDGKITVPKEAAGRIDISLDGTGFDLVVTNVASDAESGWGEGRHYVLPVDANDAYTPLKGPGHVDLWFGPSGLTRADIQTREGLPSEPSDSWIFENPAFDGAGLHYGQSEALALDVSTGLSYWNTFFGQAGFANAPRSMWVHIERGSVISGAGSVLRGVSGQDPLRPIWVKTWGSGPLPRIDDWSTWNLTENNFLLVSGLSLRDTFNVRDGKFIAFDGCEQIGVAGDVQGVSLPTAAITLRRHKGLDIYKDSPNGATWSEFGDRMQGAYLQAPSILIEKVFYDQVGFAPGYAYDNDGASPHAPGIFSHLFYNWTGTRDGTVRDVIMGRAAHASYQARGGIVMQNVVSMASNGGIILGAGAAQSSSLKPGPGPGNYNYVSDVVCTWTPFLSTQNMASETGHGLSIQAPSGTFRRIIHCNSGTRTITGTGYGPGADAGGLVATPPFDGLETWPAFHIEDHIAYGLENGFGTPFADINADGLPDLTGYTAGGYNDHWKSTSGSSNEDLLISLRAEDAPWQQVSAMLDWWQAAFQLPARPQRATSQTVVFQPKDDGSTPGIRADIAEDWSTGDAPGTYAGDGVDLDGHTVHWAINTDEPLGIFSLTGGHLMHHGGLIDCSTVSGPGNVTLDGSGYIRSSAWDAGIDLTVRGGRLELDGSVTLDGVTYLGGYHAETVTGQIVSSGSVTLSGALVVDATGLRPGQHVLIDAASISGSWTNQTVTGGTLAVTGTQVVLTVS